MHRAQLERRTRHLDDLEDRAFLAAIGPWMAFAVEDRAVRRTLAEMRDDYARATESHRAAEEQSVRRLLEVRTQIRAAAGLPSSQAVPIHGRPAALATEMRQEIRRLGSPPAIEPLVHRIEAIAAVDARRTCELTAWMHASAGGSLHRLDWLIDEVEACSEAAPVPDPDELDGTMESCLLAAYASVRPLLHAALSSSPNLTASEWRQLGHIVAPARQDALLVHGQLVRRARAVAAPPHAGARRASASHRSRGPCV